ncbi:MAG: hypothetical protein WC333_00035 [Dehalococcoidia bacterium]
MITEELFTPGATRRFIDSDIPLTDEQKEDVVSTVFDQCFITIKTNGLRKWKLRIIEMNLRTMGYMRLLGSNIFVKKPENN